MYYKIKQVYDAIYDEKSKEIFINRFINNLTGDGNYIVNIINDNCKKINGNTIGKYYKEKNYEKKLIIYGAMMSGKVRYDLHNYLKRDDIFCFCDKDINKQKSGFCGKKVISPEELVSKYTDYKVIIETKYYYDEVYKFLMDNNFPVENIILHGDNGCQYLDYEYMNFTDNEVMIDGGCYDCETIEYFIDKVKKYKKVIAFEPDKLNYKNCKKIVKDKNLLNVEIINGGLWNENCTLSFCGEGDSCSRIAENGSDSCQVYAIDNVREAQEATFIKMDIEGSELNALHGAEKTIINNKPKLAICIYHKNDDVLDIQEYLMKLVPEYRFGIRHYSDHLYETVLYAFVPKK